MSAFARGMLLVVVASVGSSLACADDSVITRVLAAVDQSTPAIVYVSRPAELAEYVESIAFDTAHAKELWRRIVDEHVGSVTETELQEALDCRRRLISSLRAMPPFAIVVHEIDVRSPVFSIVCDVDDAMAKEIAELLTQARIQVNKLGDWLSHGNTSHQVARHSAVVDVTALSSEIQVFTWSPFKVITVLPDLGNRFASGEARSLGNSRRFKRAWNSLARHERTITAYVSPSAMRPFIDAPDDVIWESWRIHEMPSAGFALQIGDPRVKGASVVGMGTLTFTLPRTGYGDVWRAARPIPEIPKIPFPFYELSVENIDRISRLEANARIHQHQFPNGPDYLQVQNERYLGLGLDYRTEVLPAFGGRLTIRYEQKYRGMEHAVPYALAMWWVEDFELARRYLSAVVANVNQNRSPTRRRMQSEDHKELVGDGLFYAESVSGAKQNVVVPGKGETDGDRVEGDARELDAEGELHYLRETQAVTAKWYLRGEYAAAIAFLRANVSDGLPNYLGDVRDRINEIGAWVDCPGPGIAIDLFTPKSWSMPKWLQESRTIEGQLLNGREAPETREETSSLVKYAIARLVLNKVGTQLRCYWQTDDQMTIGFAVFDHPSRLLSFVEGGDEDYLPSPIPSLGESARLPK